MNNSYSYRLASVSDGMGLAYYNRDIPASNSFTYKANGNLEQDNHAALWVDWTPYNKPHSYIKSGTMTSFLYDASGNRVREKVAGGVERLYIRDVQGNIQAIYEDGVCVERPLYGASRLGRLLSHDNNPFYHEYRQTEITEYEVTDHLGNVRAVINDVRRTTGEVERSELYSYYPYGFLREGGSYRYGYNGMQREDAIAGAGNTYDFGARLLSSLYGSWFSIDPLAGKYPSFSPYVAMGNNPIRYIDPDGRDWVESKDGEISWRNDVTADNFQKKGMLAEGEIYRGTSFIRKNIWTQVNINGNSESGLMEENYNSSGKMTYKNLTPWVDKAFEEMEKNIYETGGNPEITKYWKHTQLGLHNSDETPWCAAFVNYTLESVGIEGTNSALAFSFKKFGLNLGNEKPIYGAIAVMNYSHVAIVVGINNDGRVILLGGNQGNAVNLSPNSQKGVMKYVYPNEYTPSSMDLPEYSLRKRSLSRSTSR